MHLPLLDIPKPHRSRRPQCASASALFGVCLGVSLLWGYSETAMVGCGSADAPSASASAPAPVRWVTVITSDGGKDCTLFQKYEMPLRELYDELCEMEDTAETEVETMPMRGRMSNAFIEQIYLRAEQAFRKKYGLTPPQVARIKAEGSHLHKEARDE